MELATKIGLTNIISSKFETEQITLTASQVFLMKFLFVVSNFVADPIEKRPSPQFCSVAPPSLQFKH